MTPEQKRSELNQYKEVVLATIDYLEKTDGSVKFDQLDPNAEYYQHQKQETEKYYTQGKLERLHKKLGELTQWPLMSGDLNFKRYLKEKTGFDIDIFKDLQGRIDKII